MVRKEKASNLKQSEIGKIPEHWEHSALGELIEVHDSKRIPLSEMERAKRKGKYPYCGASGIMDYIDDYIFNGEFLLIAEDGGSYGKFDNSCYLMNGKFWVNNHAHIIKAKNNRTINKFLFYMLNFQDLRSYIVGSTRKKLNQEYLRQIEIPLPPLPEQQKIAEILGTVDEAIEKVDKAIEKTQRLKKGLMQELLTKGIRHKEFKDSKFGKIPKEWNVMSLGEMGALQYGFTASAKKEDTGIKFLRITDIKEDGLINWTGVPYCEISESDFKKYKLNEGDILFARIGATTGKTAFIDRHVKGIFASYLIRFVPSKDDLETKFLYFYTQSPFYWNRVNREKEGQLKKGMNATMLSKLNFPFPSLHEQKKIAEILSSVDKKLELLRKRKEKFERIKKGLMNDLLTGRKRVKV